MHQLQQQPAIIRFLLDATQYPDTLFHKCLVLQQVWFHLPVPAKIPTHSTWEIFLCRTVPRPLWPAKKVSARGRRKKNLVVIMSLSSLLGFAVGIVCSADLAFLPVTPRDKLQTDRFPYTVLSHLSTPNIIYEMEFPSLPSLKFHLKKSVLINQQQLGWNLKKDH